MGIVDIFHTNITQMRDHTELGIRPGGQEALKWKMGS